MEIRQAQVKFMGVGDPAFIQFSRSKGEIHAEITYRDPDEPIHINLTGQKNSAFADALRWLATQVEGDR